MSSETKIPLSIDWIKLVLGVMQDAGVDSFELDSLKVVFSAHKRPISSPAETPEDRLERLKSDLKQAQIDQLELDEWST